MKRVRRLLTGLAVWLVAALGVTASATPCLHGEAAPATAHSDMACHDRTAPGDAADDGDQRTPALADECCCAALLTAALTPETAGGVRLSPPVATPILSVDAASLAHGPEPPPPRA